MYNAVTLYIEEIKDSRLSKLGFYFRSKGKGKIENRKTTIKIDEIYQNKNNVKYML